MGMEVILLKNDSLGRNQESGNIKKYCEDQNQEKY